MYPSEFTIKIKKAEDEFLFILLQKIVSSFIQDYTKITNEFGSDDSFSIITKLLFRQFSYNISDTLIECREYYKGITLTLVENDILIEIVNLYSEIKHPSLHLYKEDDYKNIIHKILN